MNSGKFFQLNLEESKIVDGVAVYDYVDLPAYFGEQEGLSPQYPIRLILTSDSARFQVHYCVYELDDKHYTHQLDRAHMTVASPKIIHVQEMILELPFSHNTMTPVSTAIKRVYNTPFPSREEDGYLSYLLKQRYGQSETTTMYKKLRRDMDNDRCYSSLWLMGMRQEGGGDDKRPHYHFNLMEEEENGKYVAFLRKLLLDFMFDLKHTDVFQTSRHFMEMSSGLMSDFFFSALMHKCEYYYCRGLLLDVLGADDQNKDHLRKLYFGRLLDAEKEWVDDIMSPQSDRHFLHEEDFQKTSPGERIRQWFRDNVFEPIHTGRFITRNSWFADPEEELRRVCFTMTEKQNRKHHICNAETVAEYLGINQRRGIAELKSRISRWFLSRNAFSDVLHLHGFRYINWLLPLLLLLVTIQILFTPSFLSQDAWRANTTASIAVDLSWLVLVLVSLWAWFVPPIGKKHSELRLYRVRRQMTARRMLLWLMVFGCALALFYAAVQDSGNSRIYVSAAAVLALLTIVFQFVSTPFNLIRNVHLLLPRLIASIAAAWLTLAIGNELFSSFFDVIPSWLSCTLLSAIVLIFILYEMNRIISRESGMVKLVRSFELLVLSYLLSFLIGLFIINFTGERFLERNNSLGTFYKEYVNENGTAYNASTYAQDYVYDGPVFQADATTNLEYLDNLQHLKVTKSGDSIRIREGVPIVSYWEIGDYKFFILRDFLIQFSFLAMFIGVFIQMIFEEKNITEM